MHFDFTIHVWAAVTYLGSLSTAVTFLWQVYRQIRRGVNAVLEAKNSFLTMVDEHHELYGWYSTHVKPKQQVRKANGIGATH